MANNRRRTKPTSIDYSQFPSGYEEGLQRLSAEMAKSRFTDFTKISSRIDPVYDEIEFAYENQDINDNLDGSPAKPFANIGGRTARVKGETNPRFVYFPELADDGTPKKDGKYRNTNMHIRITDNAVYLPSIGAYVNKDSNGNAFVLGDDGTPKAPLRDVKMYIPMSEVNMLSKLKSGGVEDARPDLVKIPEAADPNYNENFFLGAGKAFVGGTQHAYYSGKAFAGALTGDTDMVLEAQEGMSKIMTSQEQRRAQEDIARRLGSEEYRKSLGFWGGLYNGIKAFSAQAVENPNGFFDTIMGMVPMGIGLGVVGAGATAATVATGGGFFAVGVAQLATMYGANTLLMGGAKAIEAASDGSYSKEEGYDAVKKGAIKALPYVGVDLLTMGITSKVMSMPTRAMERAAFANLVKNGVNPSEIEAGLTTVRQAVSARHAAAGTTNRAIIQADMETSIANYLGQSGLSKPQLVESTQEAMRLALNNSNKIMSKLPRAAIKYGSTSLLLGAGEYAGELAAEGHADPSVAVEVAFTGLGMTVAHVKLAERFNRIRKGSTEALAPNFNNELAARIYYGRMEQVAPLTPLARPAGSEEARRATTSTETGVPVGEMPAGRSPESVPRVDTEPPTITVSVDNSGIPVIRGLGNESFQESLNRANVLAYRILQEDRLARQIQSEAGGKPMTTQQELLYNDHIRRRDYLSEQLKPINEMLIANNPEPYKGDRLDAESTRAYVEEKQRLIDTRYAEIEKKKESILKGRDETDPSLTPDEVKQIERLNVEEGFVDADSQALRQIHEDVMESISQEPSPKVPRIQPEARSLAINKLNETFFRDRVAGEDGRPIFVRAATQSEIAQGIPSSNFINAIGDAVGVDVVYTKGGNGIYEGVYAPNSRRVVFLDVDANGKTPNLNILFHEFGHKLEKNPETRKTYERIKSLIFEKDSDGKFIHLNEDAYNKFLEKTALIEQNARGVDREQAIRIAETEAISEILGSASNTEAFVKSLSQKDAQRFKGMVTEFIEYINNVVNKIKERYGKTEGELMTKDLDALATKLAEIIAEIPPDGGRPTTEIQRLSYKRPEEVVKSEKFMKWFEGSKVVDEKTGLPMVMYHGTRSAFENFSLDIRPTHGASYGYGLYFTSDPRQAGAFAGEQGGNIIPTYLNIKNPLEIDGFDLGLYKAAQAEGKPFGIGKAMAEGKINDNFIKQYALERFTQENGFPVEITNTGVSKYEKSEIDRVTKIFNDRLNDPEYGYELIQEAKNEITNMINHIPYMDGEAERRIYAAGGFDGIHVRFPNKTNWFIALDPNQVSNEITGKIMSRDAEGGALFFKRPDAEENARKELSDKLSISHQLVIGRSPESIPDSVIQNIEPMRVKNALPESKERADALLTGFMREALEASGITNEKVISRLTSSDIVNSDIVKKAMELPQNVGRYWYENSARAFKNILELSYDDMKTFFRVLSATSGGLKPFQNTKLALASVSQWLNNTPVTIGLRDVKSLGKAFVSQGLTSLKFGNFAETLLRLSGLSKDNAIASVVDVQINAMAGNGSQSSPSPEIYEAISRYLLKLRDHINEQMAKEQGVSVSELKEPLEHYQLQAMLWVEYRAEKEGTSSLSSKEGKYDDYASVIPTIIKELKVNNIPLENGKITRKTLGKDLVNYVQLKAESTKGMTVTAEVGTKLTEVGKEVESTSTRVKKNLPEDQVLESVAEREKILSSTLSDLITKASGKDTKLKGTSPISRLLTHIVGDDSAEFTRAMLGKGSFEGEDGKIGVNPNLRFPLSDLITKFARFDKKGNRIRREGGGYETRAVDSNEILALLAELGKPFRQESNAASMFADRGTLDRAFYLAEKERLNKIASITVDDAFTIYVKGGLEKPSTELIESLATEIGLPINYSESAGGHMFDIHPLEWLKDRNNIENVKAAVDKLGLDANIIERDYVGFYLEEKHYDAAIEQQQDIIRSRYESAERGSSQEKAFGRVGVYSQAVSPKPEEAVRTNLFTDPLADIRTNKLEPALKKWSDKWSKKVEKAEKGEVSYKRAEDEGPKSPTVNRIPELEEAIKQRKAGNLTQEQYNQKVRELAPVELFDSVPEIAPYERIREVVNKAQAEKVESPIGENGKPLRTRVDIPSYVRSGTHVVSVHDSKNNAVISYEPFIALDGPITFGIDKEASSKIGAGEKAKYPMAFIDGKYKALSKDQIESMAKDAMSKPDEWRQVGVDPRRHGYAYDRETQDPITGAKEVIQIGGLVLAKDVTYATPEQRESIVYKRTERPTQRFVLDETKKKEFIYHYNDAFVDIKDLVKKSGQRLSYENDPAANLVQSPAKARTQNRKFREDFARAVYNATKNNGVTQKERSEFQKELSEFLHYDHATERNIQMQSVGRKSNRLEDGGSGLTEKEIRKYFNSLTEEKRNALSKAAKEIRKFDEETLELKYRYGLITDVDYANIKRAYKKHVPLMRIMPDGEIRNLRANKARMGTETTTQRAKGSLLEVSDVINNIMADREYAINQIEKNKIAKSVWNFLNLEAKRGVDTTDFGVAIDPYSMTNADKAKMVTLLDKYGLTESEISSVLSAIESEAIDARDAVPFRRPSGILQSSNILFVRDGNKFKYVVLNGVSEEARRFGQQLKILQPTDTSKFVDKMNSLTRAFTGLNTTNDPTFPVRNFILDSSGMVLNLSDTPLNNKVGAVYSNMPNAVKEIWQYSMNKSKKKTGTKLTEVQKLYEELMEFGGTHHWNEILETAEKRSQYLAEEIKALERGENLSIVEFLKAVHEANQDASENAGRLSVYMEMRKLGYTQQESAKVAKEISIDFDTSGATTRKANKLYAFLSASVGGQSRTLRAIGSTRGKQIVSGLVGLGVLQAFMLAATGLDDEIPEWEQRNNFIIPTGGKTYMKIKVRGLAPFLNIGRVSTQLATGDVINTSEKVGGLFSSFRDMLDPFGQTGSFLQTITPTIFRPVVSLLENKNWTGEKLYNEKFTNEDVNPAYTRAKRKTTAASIALSEFLNNHSGGSPYLSGKIDIPPEVFDSIVSSYGGGYGRIVSQIKRAAEEKRVTNLPVIREVAGAGKPEQMNTTYYYNIIKEINRLDKAKSGYEEDGNDYGLTKFKKENPQYKHIEDFKKDINEIKVLEKKARASGSDEERTKAQKKADGLKAKLVENYRKKML